MFTTIWYQTYMFTSYQSTFQIQCHLVSNINIINFHAYLTSNMFTSNIIFWSPFDMKYIHQHLTSNMFTTIWHQTCMFTSYQSTFKIQCHLVSNINIINFHAYLTSNMFTSDIIFWSPFDMKYIHQHLTSNMFTSIWQVTSNMFTSYRSTFQVQCHLVSNINIYFHACLTPNMFTSYTSFFGAHLTWNTFTSIWHQTCSPASDKWHQTCSPATGPHFKFNVIWCQT